MQLKKFRSVKGSLAIATASLLGQTGAATAAVAQDQWEADAAVLHYTEKDRVQATEAAVNLHKKNDDESEINLRFTYDTLSGASPNGAAAAGVPQTFTSASGRNSSGGNGEREDEDEDEGDDDEHGGSSYTAKAGETPLDSSFRDVRYMGSVGFTTPFADVYKWSLGGAFSTEEDFTSLSVNSMLARDFNQRNTTVSLGFNYEYDMIDPIGGVPDALTSYAAGQTAGESDSKQVVDMIFGMTQVMNRRWITQLNFSVSQSSGYQDDPYKIVTVADQGNLIIDPNDSASYLYLYEHRPEDRQKISIYWQNKIAIGSNSAFTIGYRYMTDDWGVDSHTYDLGYHWGITENFYVEPHYRYYQQTAADFYVPFLNAGDEVLVNGSNISPQVDFASSDPRLGAFGATTLGLKLGMALGEDQDISLKFETYEQTDRNDRKATPTGSHLDGQDQFAELSASWVQLEYKLRW